MDEEEVKVEESTVSDAQTETGQNQDVQSKNNGVLWLTQLPKDLRNRVKSPESYKNFAEYMTELMDKADSSESKGKEDGEKAEGNEEKKDFWDEESFNNLTKELYSLEVPEAGPVKAVLDVLKDYKSSAELTGKILNAWSESGQAFLDYQKSENEKKEKELEKKEKEELISFVEKRFGTGKEKRQEAANVIGRGFDIFKNFDPEMYESASNKGFLKSVEFMSIANALSKSTSEGQIPTGGGKENLNSPNDPFGLFRKK